MSKNILFKPCRNFLVLMGMCRIFFASNTKVLETVENKCPEIAPAGYFLKKNQHQKRRNPLWLRRLFGFWGRI